MNRHRGAALLSAMLTVTLVATLAAAALWQQWRGVEVEAAERRRAQLSWVLVGALDWARLILREDARTGQIDHLSEPWALPLQEARLSSFLAVDQNHTDDALDAFLSGQINDLQARLNVRNLIEGGKLSEPALLAFGRLFRLLGLPESQLATLAENLRAASAGASSGATTPLPPQRVEQLGWLGLPPETLRLLAPHITLLPIATPVNLNTASAEVIYASVPAIGLAQANKLVNQRANAHFGNVIEALQAASAPAQTDVTRFSIASRFFEVRGQLRLDQVTVQERSLLERQGLDVKVLWREREVVSAPTTGSSASLQ